MTYRNLLFRSINVSIDRLRIITGYTGIENEIHRTTLIEKKKFLTQLHISYCRFIVYCYYDYDRFFFFFTVV